jgi:uncharacterized membrane protein YjgN (DUF898 family)
MSENANPAQTAEPNFLPFTFTGTAKEYFGIWIVNLFLSIVTVGIYTAWAKVRRLRYFYGNTWLDGHNFEYHAQPMQILIGRLIVFGILVVLNVLTSLSPVFLLLFIPYLIAFPWLINKSLAFNARMTSYRNIRFNFRGSYWGSMWAFLAMPIIAMFSGGVLAPVSSQITADYLGRNTGYGVKRFHTEAPLGPLFANLGMTVLFVIVAGLAFATAGALLGGGVAALVPESLLPEGFDPEQAMVVTPLVAGLVGFYISIFLAYIFYAAGARNVAFNATTLDGRHRFRSQLSRPGYVWLLVSNLFVVLFTLLLMRPWAAVRTWRYVADRTQAGISGTLDAVVDTAAPQGNVGAAEYFDIEGIDFGL